MSSIKEIKTNPSAFSLNPPADVMTPPEEECILYRLLFEDDKTKSDKKDALLLFLANKRLFLL
tara:strand:- start:280 stop:468 length:189 start_codon:yes stop_codon:yes gene_type:complete